MSQNLAHRLWCDSAIQTRASPCCAMQAIALLSPRVMIIVYHWMSGWCNSAIECKGPSLQTTIVYVGISGHQLKIVLLCKVNGLDWLSWNSHYCWTFALFLLYLSCRLFVPWCRMSCAWVKRSSCLPYMWPYFESRSGLGTPILQWIDMRYDWDRWPSLDTNSHDMPESRCFSFCPFWKIRSKVGLRACCKSWLLNTYSLVMWWGKIMVSCVGASAVQENSMFYAGKDNSQCLLQRWNITANKVHKWCFEKETRCCVAGFGVQRWLLTGQALLWWGNG